MNEKQYILNNWKAYDIVDNAEEMLELLNILEAHNESLDSLHDAVCQYDMAMFCDIYGKFETDRDVATALFEHHFFFENEYDLYLFMEERCFEEDVRKTTDGFIVVLWY